MRFNSSLSNVLHTEGISTVEEAEQFFYKQIELLQQAREISLGLDKDLGGKSLELRVKEIFHEAGFNIIDGRKGCEDFIVEPHPDYTIQEHIVLEVKSSGKPAPNLDDFRQLDDWVFYLSGEEAARKNRSRVGGFNQAPSMGTHPTPHKGVFIFNGQLGVDFEKRNHSFVHPSHLEFIAKRNFCAISLNSLIDLLSESNEYVWDILHKTVGEYKSSNLR
jgi:hypothetical protein